uniref:Uncharacterized protein n=1 Tax=Anguilla anguilla TaxID=7936 RepID=A0A0E9UF02_ANGAN
MTQKKTLSYHVTHHHIDLVLYFVIACLMEQRDL